MKIELYTSSFCAPCHAARAAVGDAVSLVEGLTSIDLDVAAHEGEAQARDIRSTPTIVLTDDEGHELFRAAGAPTVSQLLTAIARHS